MEEEDLSSSLPDCTEPEPDSWTSIEQQLINGEQKIENEKADKLSLSTKRDSAEEADSWDQVLWPTRPMTCTSPQLSFATVQWDKPGPLPETPSLVTHGKPANESDSVSVTSAGSTSSSPHPSIDINDELFPQEDEEKEEGLDSQLVNRNTFEPCDAVDVQERMTQEEEESIQELLGCKDENPLRKDDEEAEEENEEEENRESGGLDPVEIVDLIESYVEIPSSEDESDNFVDLKLKEEQEELDVLLTRQEDSEEEQTSVEDSCTLLTVQGDFNEEQTYTKSVEIEVEKGEEDEDKRLTIASYLEESEEGEPDCHLSDVEGPVELLQTDDTESTVKPDKPLDLESFEERRHSATEEEIEIVEALQESATGQTEGELERVESLNGSPTGPSEELEMREDVDRKIVPEQLEAVDKIEEQSIQVAGNGEKVEDSRLQDQTENLHEISCLLNENCDQTSSKDEETVTQPEHLLELEQVEMTEEIQVEEQNSKEQVGQYLEQSDIEMTEESTQTEEIGLPQESSQTELTVCVNAGDPGATEEQEERAPQEQNEQQTDDQQLLFPENTGDSEVTEQLQTESEVTQEATEQEVTQEATEQEVTQEATEQEVTQEATEQEVTQEATEQEVTQEATEQEVTQEATEQELRQEDKQAETSHQAEDEGGDESIQIVVANGVQPKPSEASVPHMNGDVDRDAAHRLAERLFKLDGFQRFEVVKHLDKDNDFSKATGEEYLKFFDFTGQTLDHALRSFLKVVVLIGETQERERVLQHFACRFHQCNPDSFSSPGSVLALTCALMLLNTDLHGQNVGKSMSSSKFVLNLDGMNDEENFNKDLLKSLYNSIKNEPLEWAVDEEELKSSLLLEEDAGQEAPLRSKANPFQDLSHNKRANVVKQAFLQRKIHADIDGKRTPWGKRGWKTFYGVLRGMLLYLQKDDYRKDQMTIEEVVSVHHSVAGQANEYTKKPHVFRLQTADWRVFLFQASSKAEMNSWISRINLVSALQSSPPFPAAVGSQRRFFRPILPASQSADTLENQLQSHTKMLESFKADLLYLQQNPPESKKTKAKELEEHRVRAEYLQHEVCRYEIYMQVLQAWKSVKKTEDNVFSIADLNAFDTAMCTDSLLEGEDEESSLKRSHSSPSLELEVPTPTIIKVRRNISERRTYRRTIIPRWNKET